MVDAQLVHYQVRVRLMSYRPSMVDAQLVHNKAWVRLMSYWPNMIDAQLVTPRPKRVCGMCNRMCTKGFLNYFSAIIEFLKVVLKELWHFYN